MGGGDRMRTECKYSSGPEWAYCGSASPGATQIGKRRSPDPQEVKRPVRGTYLQAVRTQCRKRRQGQDVSAPDFRAVLQGGEAMENDGLSWAGRGLESRVSVWLGEQVARGRGGLAGKRLPALGLAPSWMGQGGLTPFCRL